MKTRIQFLFLGLAASLALVNQALAATLITINNSGFETDNVLTNSGLEKDPLSWTRQTVTGVSHSYVGDNNWLNTVASGGIANGLIAGARSGSQYYLGYAFSGTTEVRLHQDTSLAWSTLRAGDTLTLSVWATYRNDFPGSANVAMWLNSPDVGATISSVNSGPGWFNVSSTGPAAGVWTQLTWNYTVTQTAIIAAAANTWGNVNVGIGFSQTTGSQVVFDDVGLTYTSIPEPSTALLGGLGMLALLRRRRG